MRSWGSGAAPLPLEIVEPFEKKFGGRIQEGYGLTEASPYKTIFRPVGCPACEGHGYKGRSSIVEILKITGDLDDLIGRRASTRDLLKCAKTQGFKPLIDDATRRVLDGTTSVDEISRVVDLTERLRD